MIAESLMLGVKIFGPHKAWDLGRRCTFEESRAPLLLISLKLDESDIFRSEDELAVAWLRSYTTEGFQ